MPITELNDRTALIAIDLQQGIAGGEVARAHPVGDVLAATRRMADAFRERGLPVVIVTVEPTDFAQRTDAGARGAHELPQGFADPMPELGEHPDDVRVVKNVWNAFHGTELHERLRAVGVTQVVMAGIATSVGVESTARDARDHGYQVAFASDAMTDASAEAHEHSVMGIFTRIGQVGSADDVIALLPGEPVTPPAD